MELMNTVLQFCFFIQTRGQFSTDARNPFRRKTQVKEKQRNKKKTAFEGQFTQ